MISLLGPLLGALLLDESRDDLGTLRELRGRVGTTRATLRDERPVGSKAIIQRAVKTWLPHAGPVRAFEITSEIALDYRFGPDDPPSSADVLLEWALRHHLTESYNLGEHQRRMVRDWWDAVRPDLGRFTPQSAWQASRRWHDEITKALETSGGRAVPPGRVVMTWPDGWSVHRIMDRETLQREGESMQNCLAHGAYADEMERGSVWIFSVRKPPVPGGWSVPVATLTFDHTFVSDHQLIAGPVADYIDHTDVLDIDPISTDAPDEALDRVRQHSEEFAETYIDDPEHWADFFQWMGSYIADPSFEQIRGRQNLPPKAEYQPRVRRFMEAVIGDPDSGDEAEHLWRLSLGEAVWMLTPDDALFHRAWSGDLLEKKVLETWGDESIQPLEPEQWHSFLGSPERVEQVMLAAVEGTLAQMNGFAEEFPGTPPLQLAVGVLSLGGSLQDLFDRIIPPSTPSLEAAVLAYERRATDWFVEAMAPGAARMLEATPPRLVKSLLRFFYGWLEWAPNGYSDERVAVRTDIPPDLLPLARNVWTERLGDVFGIAMYASKTELGASGDGSSYLFDEQQGQRLLEVIMTNPVATATMLTRLGPHAPRWLLRKMPVVLESLHDAHYEGLQWTSLSDCFVQAVNAMKLMRPAIYDLHWPEAEPVVALLTETLERIWPVLYRAALEDEDATLANKPYRVCQPHEKASTLWWSILNSTGPFPIDKPPECR